MSSTSMMCPNPTKNYDADTNLGGVLFILMAGLYVAFVTYMIVQLSYTLRKDPRARKNYFNIAFFLFVLLELIIRIVYFPGCVRPFCYGINLYIILSDYPCLAQSISMVMLICRYLETLSLIQHENETKFKWAKYAALVFAVLYTLVYTMSHTTELLYNDADLHINYIFACAGQTVILVAFTLTSMYLMQQMQQVCSSLTSQKMKCVLIAFSVLLAIRIVLAILNIAGITKSLRENGQVYILLTVFYPAFEVAPAILLLIFSFLQEQQRTDMNKKRVDIKEIIKTSSIRSANEAKEKDVELLLERDSPSKRSEDDQVKEKY